jgi:polyisoprenoid-binding protein YceI
MAMKYLWATLLVQLLTVHSFAQSTTPGYMPSGPGSSVVFMIKNLGFNTRGSFGGLQGSILFDPQNTVASSFDVSVDAATINTDNEQRDDHLKKQDYFDVKDYPRIRFVSSSISAANSSGHYTVTGKLTIKNSTKEISFPFIATPQGNDYIFKGGFQLNRKEFGVGGSSTLSNNVTVSLTIMAKKV